LETPYLRARAKDNVDALDNLLSGLSEAEADEITDYIASTYRDIEKVLEHAADSGLELLSTYKMFVAKVRQYAPVGLPGSIVDKL
jgi:NTP pyrophosphatase (non-canonical NTP hydrolase)